MNPSRIVKSAHRRAGGCMSLKSFALAHLYDATDLGRACKAWLVNKSSSLVDTAEVSRGR